MSASFYTVCPQCKKLDSLAVDEDNGMLHEEPFKYNVVVKMSCYECGFHKYFNHTFNLEDNMTEENLNETTNPPEDYNGPEKRAEETDEDLGIGKEAKYKMLEGTEEERENARRATDRQRQKAMEALADCQKFFLVFDDGRNVGMFAAMNGRPIELLAIYEGLKKAIDSFPPEMEKAWQLAKAFEKKESSKSEDN